MKKIVRLRFDTWSPFRILHIGLAQPLFGFAALRIDASRQASLRERCEATTCPCCGTDIVQQESNSYDDDSGTHITYLACLACGFWRHFLTCGIQLGVYQIPSVKEFKAESDTPSLSHLAAEMRAHPENLYDFDPHKFELFAGSVLGDFYDCEVHHVGRTGDDGIDLIALVKDEPLLVQVKRRSKRDAVEGLNVVKLLFASAFARDANHGMVLTTASRFSKNATEWVRAPRLVDSGFRFNLIDFPSLMSMLDCVAAKNDPPPWLAHKEHASSESHDSDQNWQLTPGPDFDYLFRPLRDGVAQAVLFDHRSLEDCTIVVANVKHLQEVLNAWRPGIPLRANDEIHVGVCRNDENLERTLNVPFDVADQMTARWVRLYPNRVLDDTP